MTYDAARGCVMYKVSGAVTGRDVMAALRNRLERHPELATADAICDLRAYVGDVSAYDMHLVAEEANKRTPPSVRLARTAFITHDPSFPNWARVLTHQFEGREFRVFDSMEAADAWLGERGERPPDPPG